MGAVMRYIISKYAGQTSHSFFPTGTMIVNVVGCFVIGFVYAYSTRYVMDTHIKSMLLIGFVGAFTTFSTYIFESFELVKDREYIYFFMNILLSNVLGMLFLLLGILTLKFIVDVLK